jgi:predicted lipoprotein with Yx(FWY)xxD motif
VSPIRIACASMMATLLLGCARKDSTSDTTLATSGAIDSSAAATPSASSSAAAGTPAVALGTASSTSLGTYLADANGRSVYVFMKDKKDVSTCVDACAAAWPPFSAGSASSADSSVKSAMVGTIARSDTRSQTSYNGMPLYYYEDDKQPGEIEGQGKNEFGGLWYVVSPRGQKITKKK